MNKASILCIALMGGFTGAVCAASDSEIPIEHYSYAMKLDVAKVISISEAQDVCGAVPEHMIYEDSKGGQARSGVSGDGRWLRRRITIWAHA